uniref:Uncharacterized protein n=1 Tax=Alexandrium monilatum TaxID=311494 RepID=A0A7S4UKA2_9DINO|mmetsp:Transcript_87264/g.260318  ORF Transcript_87264/g.260318 Transcript_87264/m.260318 type:complete len:193 (+) Transcript_87264:103-681(+)
MEGESGVRRAVFDDDGASETFERAPVPASGPVPVADWSPGALASRLASPQHIFQPARREEAQKELELRQIDLDDDEELARQLAAQLRLTSPAEHDTASSEDHLQRLSDGRGGPAQRDDSERDRHGIDDTNYGVEYHALASDGEEESFVDQPRTGVTGYAPLICSVLTGLFRAGGPRGRHRGVEGEDLVTSLR